MWNFRRLYDPRGIHLMKNILRNNFGCKETRFVFIERRIPHNIRLLQTTQWFLDEKKSQYEYDPRTDSFRPAQHTSYTYGGNNQQNNSNNSSNTFVPFLKRFIRNLFLITGGVIWVGVVVVSLFVDVKDEEILHHIKDFDDEVRLLAFYDIGQSKTDLARMMSKEKNLSELYNTTDHKQTAFEKVIRQLQHHDVVQEKLGAPVHLCGFRAATKIGHMIQSFQHLAEHGIKEHLTDEVNKNTWKAQCILEGTTGLALLSLEFQKLDTGSDWVPVKIELSSLDTTERYFMEKHGDLPRGISLT